MNKEHPNISILKKFNPANPSTVAEVLAEDFFWHYINPELSELEGGYFDLSGLTYFFQKLTGRTMGYTYCSYRKNDKIVKRKP